MRDLVEAAVAADYQTEWGEVYLRPLCVIQIDSIVIWRNAAFKTLLDNSNIIRERAGSLSFTSAAIQASFMAFIHALDGRPGAWLGPERENASRLILRCERILPAGRAPGIACVVYDTGYESPYVWVDLREAFGLTASEARIARNLADGGTLRGLASEMGITSETAKTHLRRIYAKIGSSSREEFYARILPFRVV